MKTILYESRELYKFIRGIFIYIRLKYHLYQSIQLPDYDFKFLQNKWPFMKPCCVSEKFNNMTKNSDIILSIIIPLFNSQEYISNLIQMFATQNTKFKFEVIMINDGSTDKTERVLMDKIQKAGEISFIKYINQNNGGISRARNTGIDNAVGKYIAFVDHDDEVSSSYVEKLIFAAENNGAQIVKCKYGQKYNTTVIDAGLAKGFVWGGIYDRKIFKKIRFPVDYWYEDMINNFILYPQASKIVNLDEILYYKNSTKQNASKKLWKADNYKCIEHVYLVKYLINAYRKLGLKDKNYLFDRVLFECSFLAVERTKFLDLETRKQVFQLCRNMVLEVDNETRIEDLERKSKAFYKSFLNCDFAAWLLASKL